MRHVKRIKRIRVKVDGEERESLLIEKVYERKKKMRVSGKTYEYIDRRIIVYIPKDMSKYKSFLVVPWK